VSDIICQFIDLVHEAAGCSQTVILAAISLSLSCDELRTACRLVWFSAHCQVDFGKDLEQHLGVLVDCRASFPNLDLVKDRLVLAALRLCAKTLKLVKGRHNKKTLGFVKGCFAFCHITIPSIDDIRSRLQLFKLAGEIALVHLCLPQADTFFKAVIQEILEVPELEGAFSRPCFCSSICAFRFLGVTLHPAARHYNA
jgi:hypothetical protein